MLVTKRAEDVGIERLEVSSRLAVLETVLVLVCKRAALAGIVLIADKDAVVGIVRLLVCKSGVVSGTVLLRVASKAVLAGMVRVFV